MPGGQFQSVDNPAFSREDVEKLDRGAWPEQFGRKLYKALTNEAQKQSIPSTASKDNPVVLDDDTRVLTTDQAAAMPAGISSSNKLVASNDARIPTADEKAALAGTGTPSAANKYVTNDTFLAGLNNRDIKDNVRVATTAALPANTRTGNKLTADANGAFPSIDGVALSSGASAPGADDGVEIDSDHILVQDEATGANNGIYFLSDPGDASNPWVLTRRADFDADAEVTAGAIVGVEEGTENGDQRFHLTTNNPIQINTTALTFAPYSGRSAINSALGTTDAAAVNASAGAGDAGKLVKLDAAGKFDVSMIPELTAALTNVGLLHHVTIPCTGSAGGDFDKALPTGTWDVIDCHIVNGGAGEASDTVQLKTTGGDNITNAMDASGASGALVRASTLDSTNSKGLVGGTTGLRATQVDAAGGNAPAIDVHVTLRKVA